MVADFILRLLGDDPIQYANKDKWPMVGAIVIDLAVPLVIAFSFFIPLIVMKWCKWPLNFRNVSAAVTVGLLLATGVYWLNQWSYGYGVGVIFNELNPK